ncbi:MAG: hypothetical protein ACYS0D_04460 [Planctomycetota bacterium]
MNGILGTESNVRIVRLLATTTVPLSKAAVARRAALNESGVGRAIADLIAWGIVESLGAGPRHLYRLRAEHPLASPLADLFASERARFEAFVDGLQSAVHRLRPPPRAAWIEGPVATEADRRGDPVIVGILASAKTIDQAARELRALVIDLERAYDITVSILGLTTADFAALPEARRTELEETMPLMGPPPMELWPGPRFAPAESPPRSHEQLDRQALALAQAIAARLAENPSLREQARQYIKRRLERASAGERRELEEWDQILQTMSIARLRRFLVEPSQRATRLRQTLPFVDALSRKEREAIRKDGHDQG